MFLDGSVLLILGSMLIGWITGPTGMAQVEPLVKNLFLGVLCLFLLDMGIVAAQRFRDFQHSTAGRREGQPLKLMLLPEADPATYLTMSLAITFPFNLLVGIPAYHALIR